MEKEENILGREKISKLIRKFSIPCIISLLVSSLYNIVDQIFIGWGVGYLGNGATNVVFPLTMIGLAFSLMFGDGSSAYLSLKLGEKKKEEATKGVGNGIMISTLISILYCIITLIFLPQLLNVFGCTDNLRELALQWCANFILKDYKNTLNIFVYSDIENEIQRATKYYGLDKENAAREINRINKLRSNHYKYYTEKDWKSPADYDICINSDALGVEKSSELICNLVKSKISNQKI